MIVLERRPAARRADARASRPAAPSGPVYRRIRNEGPMNGFGYSWFDDRLARAGLTRPRLLAREPDGEGPSFGYEALNLVDGRRSVGEIRDDLAATLGAGAGRGGGGISGRARAARRAGKGERLMDLGIAGRSAIVCASSKGLGRACATELARAGARVAINGRDAELLEQVRGEIAAETGAEVIAIAGDMSTPEGRAALLGAFPRGRHPRQQQWRAAAARFPRGRS